MRRAPVPNAALATAASVRPGRAALIGALALAAASTVIGGCGNNDDTGASAGSSSTASSTANATAASGGPTTTTWVAPDDDPTQPSPAAVAADEAYRVAPDDLFDCGVHVRTSGYPTTVHPGIDVLDCILDAAAAGTPAQFVSTARDFEGGMEGTIFRVVGGQEILVIDYRADPQGVITSTETTCASLVGTNFPIPECG